MKDNYDEIAEPRHLYDSLLQGPLPMQSCNVLLDIYLTFLKKQFRFSTFIAVQFTKNFWLEFIKLII